MPPQNQQGPNDSLNDIKKTLMMAILAISIMACAQRLPFYDPMTIGARAIGKEAIICALVVYPLFVQFSPPKNETGAMVATYLWPAMIGLVFVHGLISKLNTRRRHIKNIGNPFGGALGEVVLPFLAVAAAWPLCEGISWFFGLGWCANMAEIALINLRRRIQKDQAESGAIEAEMLQREMYGN